MDGMHVCGLPTSKILGYMTGIIGKLAADPMLMAWYNLTEDGANNHKQTTIFGFRLVLDETIASYKWMLENLLEKNVMTNANEQMFRDLFSKWLYAKIEIVDFEHEWGKAANVFGFRDTCWAM
ncbi:hypothetical protein Ahy_B04g071286 [Arachis hypogaea]|uniref:Protein FAR1-RELATED SEQUENCE n=1 Tax=Arachis hypogaea TaxID=3818 RepID=A0A444ZKD4_ARAHY|nr:hypothetical protein Ahy_B04g071286 [Arachis hypogaea]